MEDRSDQLRIREELLNALKSQHDPGDLVVSVRMSVKWGDKFDFSTHRSSSRKDSFKWVGRDNLVKMMVDMGESAALDLDEQIMEWMIGRDDDEQQDHSLSET